MTNHDGKKKKDNIVLELDKEKDTFKEAFLGNLLANQGMDLPRLGNTCPVLGPSLHLTVPGLLFA